MGEKTAAETDCVGDGDHAAAKVTATSPAREAKATTYQKGDAPDGGWGWFCVLGCAVMHYLLGGTERSFGIIYLELLDRFQGTAALTAWIPALNTAVRMFCGPLVSMLVNQYGCRRIVMIGGILSALGWVLSAFAPNLYFLYFSLALLAGFGGSLSYSPALVIVGKYFNKKRAIATGLGCAGTGVGSFSIPPLFQLLLTTYSYFGAMIIYGGLMLNLCVVGALFRPLSMNFKKQNKEQEMKLLPSERKCQKGEKVDVEAASGDIKSYKENHDEYRESQKYEPDETIQVKLLSESKKESDDKAKEDIDKREKISKMDNNPKSKLFDWSLLKDGTYLSLGFTIFLYAQGYLTSIILLPPLARERGLSRAWIDGILAVVGLCDFIGRIGSGLIFDARKIKPHRRHLFNSAIFLSGMSSFSCIFAYGEASFVIIAAVFGLSTAVIVSQRSVIMADLLGVEKLSSSFGFSTVFQGAAALIGPAFGGLLKDITGTYMFVYVYCGSSSILGSVLFFSEYFITRKLTRRNSEKLVRNKNV